MFFTDQKHTSLRESTAKGELICSQSTILALKEKTLPKGDAIEMARTAGIMAAKRTPDLIPCCHPLPLDGVNVEIELETDRVIVTSYAKTVWRTGVEMEALQSCTTTLLTLYDMCKQVDKEMLIGNVRLTHKSGGKSDYKSKANSKYKVAILSTTDKKNLEGLAEVYERLRCEGLNEIVERQISSRYQDVKAALDELVEQEYDLILTRGGTGINLKDQTVWATKDCVDRELNGMAELVRNYGWERSPLAMLSNSTAGVKNGSLIVNLPGSKRGTSEALDALFPVLLKGLATLKQDKGVANH